MDHSPAFLALVSEVMPRIKEIDASDLKARMENEKDLCVIDVREDHEWEAGHIPGATHLGKGIIERDIEKTVLKKNMPIVLYCGGGFRSALAADNLQKMGYDNVCSLRGGFRGWNSKN